MAGLTLAEEHKVSTTGQLTQGRAGLIPGPGDGHTLCLTLRAPSLLYPAQEKPAAYIAYS